MLLRTIDNNAAAGGNSGSWPKQIVATEREVPGDPDKVEVLGPLSEEDKNRLTAAMSTFRDLAAEMKSLWLNSRWPMWLVVKLGYDVRGASAALLGVSNTIHRKGSELNRFRTEVESALRFRSTE